MNPRYEKLKSLLLELFQLNEPDLDFGLYRIMHARSGEVTQFLDHELLPQIKEAFAGYKSADKSEIERELAKAIEQAASLGVDPESTPAVKSLRTKLSAEAIDIAGLEAEVFDHLHTFFRRYYSEGDFLSKRVYKEGTYAIPYEGEEVTLHWANKDQYYIKSSETLRDYTFRLRPDDPDRPMRVHFRLVDAAEGEHGNVKAVEGKERIFVLAAAGASGHDFLDLAETPSGPELSIHFEYRPATLSDWPDEVREGKSKPPAQKELLAQAAKRILAVNGEAFAPWVADLAKQHVTVKGETADYSRLEGHLRRYAARNTFDYFIHKDLGGFLRRELDFFIKNEVMHLDDIESSTAPRVEQYLSKIKVLRRIAGKIIEFLAQLENFQKKLWLKKKFVVETQWLIRLGCVSDGFLEEIAKNDAQREEWVRLCAIDDIKGDMVRPGYSVPLSAAFLKDHPTLVIDTKHFDADFAAHLTASISSRFDDDTDGILLNGENFQALSVITRRFAGAVQSIYTDPPYNTAASEITYKNNYKHSSWLSLLHCRLGRAQALLSQDGIACVAIDDAEHARLEELLADVFGDINYLATVVVRSKPQGRAMAAGFSVNHEYGVFYRKSASAMVGRLPREGDRLSRYPESDERGSFAWANFRGTGANSYRTHRPLMYYPIYVNTVTRGITVPEVTFSLSGLPPVAATPPAKDEVTLYPIDDSSVERVWMFGSDRAREECSTELEAREQDGKWQIYRKYRANAEGSLPGTWWGDPKYSASESGTKTLADILGSASLFSYPKSICTVEDSIRASSLSNERYCLDFFGGSGTTGHAVINLNREDGGRRKMLLVEMGGHFDSVLVPRLKKVSYTPEWKDGKPRRLATPEEGERSPRLMKIIRLESYEDTLNNLDLRRTDSQKTLLEAPAAKGADKLREQYLLRYMLDVETRGSQSLLNVDAFADPTAYKLKVRRPGSDENRDVCVDLVETFSWLVGLTVHHLAAPQTFAGKTKRDGEGRLILDGALKPHADGPHWFRTVTGTTPDGKKALIVWRKLLGEPEADNLVLDEWFRKSKYSTKDSEFDVIWVNGDNNLENLKTPDDQWKVRLIEEDFFRLMFAEEDA